MKYNTNTKTRKTMKTRKNKTKKHNPENPKKSFDVYIDKNPKDTIQQQKMLKTRLINQKNYTKVKKNVYGKQE